VLIIYRRHRRACPHRSQGRKYRRCQCPIWADGFLGGQEIRKSLGLRDWTRAQDTVRQWEAENRQTVEQVQPVTIAEAVEKFLADAEARKLNESTIYKYKLLFGRLKDFAARRGLRFLSELDVDTLSGFRAEWKDGPRSSLKKLERLRAFFHFAERRKWVEGNPASELKAPKITVRPTMPFTRDEMVKILAGLEKYAQRAGRANAQRLRAFVFLLRYSGMRIGDAVRLSVDRIVGNRLFLYTAKTGTPVYCVLPDFVIRALEVSSRSSARYFFWTGESKLHSAIGKWQRRLGNLFRLVEVLDGHAHRFRDTFAVELLLAGVPLERVSVLLGHQNLRVTEKHYAPWVRSRQEQLEADLARAWAQDSIVLLEGKGTPEVHGKSERPN
jgi:integrase/recombinase XerD